MQSIYHLDKVFITNIPSFYKIKLYNKIAEHQKIKVIFLEKTHSDRLSDFYDEPIQFEYKFTNNPVLILYIASSAKEVVLGGWSYSAYWFVNTLLSSKHIHSVAVESSVYESEQHGLKKILKQLFLKKINRAYVSGEPQKKLLENLCFTGKTIKTYGVGLYNRVVTPSFSEKKTVAKFLYVGRFVPAKNLPFIINYFNRHPEFQLTLVGYGPLEDDLKRISSSNILFLPPVENKKLYEIYQQNDVFVLPSVSEAWGLVVQEALNNGLPVLVSEFVGCNTELITDGRNGYIFKLTPESFSKAVNLISDVSNYNKIRKNVCSLDYELEEQKQVEAYLA